MDWIIKIGFFSRFYLVYQFALVFKKIVSIWFIDNE